MAEYAGPLARFSVLDLTRVRAGPTAVRQLADWGADVIKIEAPAHLDSSPDGGTGRHGPDFQNLHRNKRSLTLNLKDPRGIAVLRRLAAQADVLVENYRPEVKRQLGIDYPALSALNPKLVYASISGFGEDGPYAGRPGFDQIAQGLGGLMSITGLPGQGPVRAGIPVADLSAGLYAALGILVALLEREVSGEGQWLRTSLLQAQIAMLDFQAARWLIDGEVPGQAGNNHPTSIPTGVFRTADGYINVAASGPTMWRRLCEILGLPDVVDHPDFATERARSDNREALNAILQESFEGDTSENWVARMNDAGVPCGPINRIDAVFADPQVQHLATTAPVHHDGLGTLRLLSQPVAMSRTPSQIHRAAPERGEHGEAILQAAGLTPSEIEALREDGVV